MKSNHLLVIMQLYLIYIRSFSRLREFDIFIVRVNATLHVLLPIFRIEGHWIMADVCFYDEKFSYKHLLLNYKH